MPEADFLRLPLGHVQAKPPRDDEVVTGMQASNWMTPREQVRAYFRAGRPVHLPVDPTGPGPGEEFPFALLPGDPERVERIAAHLENPRIIGRNREFTVAVGTYRGCGVTVCSTGIGGPSTEIAVLELAALGVHTLIRTGGTGALDARIPPGSLIINHAMMRDSGPVDAYAPPTYPAAAHPEVVAALTAAAEELGFAYTCGIGATTASYYQGQGRAILPGGDEHLARFRHLGIINLEMEAATLLALASLLGLRAGVVLGVHINRALDRWDDAYEATQDKVIRVALEAVRRLGRGGAAASKTAGGTSRRV